MLCKQLVSSDKKEISEASEISRKLWGEELGANIESMNDRVKNGIVIAAMENKEIYGSISAVLLAKKEFEKNLYSWDQITANGTLKTHNPNGNVLVCVSISVLPHKNKNLSINKDINSKIELNDKNLEKYANSDKDPVMKFHHKPKGGFAEGAKLIKIIENGRPDDEKSLGYNFLLKYPDLTMQPIFTETKSTATHLIEAAMQHAYKNDVKEVYAYSRCSDLDRYFWSG